MQACSDPRQGGTQQLRQHRLVPGHEVPRHRVPWSLGLSQSPPPFSVFLLGHDVARLQGSSDKFTSCSLKAIVIRNLAMFYCCPQLCNRLRYNPRKTARKTCPAVPRREVPTAGEKGGIVCAFVLQDWQLLSLMSPVT